MVTVSPIMGILTWHLVRTTIVSVMSGSVMFNFFYASCNYMVFGMIELLPTTLDFTDGVDVKECSDEADHSVGPVPTSLPIVIGSPSSCDKGLIYSGIEGHTKTEHEDHGTISVDRFGWDVSLGAASGHNITG